MPTYKAPVEDALFLLNDVFGFERYNNLPGFADATPDLVEAILAEGAKLCEEILAPLNRIGDQEGCRRNDDASVTTIGVLVGLMFLLASAQNFVLAAVADSLRWLWALFGLLFIGLTDPGAFRGLAALLS